MADPQQRRRVLVVTVVHHPLDARVYQRQVRTLLDRGWRVAYAAPWRAREVEPPGDVIALDLPRASRRDRLRALVAARRLLRRHAGAADLVVLHDPELLIAAAGLRLPPTVWDVHEDLRSALTDKTWIPASVLPVLRGVVTAVEGWAERRHHLLLAEDAYAQRFRRPHPVVPNYPLLADPVEQPEDRVIYVGRISAGRGALEMLELGRRLHGELTVELIGYVEPEVAPALEAAVERGTILWSGYLPNREALARVAGAIAGLSLLHDEPNYRHSLPTKVYEYLGAGVPVVTTPLPLAESAVRACDAGIVVPFGDVDAAEAALRRLHHDRALRREMGARGRAAALAGHSWDAVAPDFVEQLAAWAR